MNWLKRNLGLAISGVISLALLGLASYFLLMKKATADEASTKLQEATERLQTLVNRNPGASVENIAAAKEDQKKIEGFLADLKHFFVTPSYPTQITSRDFGVHLYQKVNDLQQGAKAAGVTLPADFQFSFASQMKTPNIPTNALGALAAQLAEIESICNVLFQAKIHELQSVKRASVTSDETAGIGDFLTAKGDTNEFTIITPYDVKFKGFSGDLANVLEGLIKAENCIAVKDLVIQRVDAAQTNEEAMTSMPMQSYMNPMLMQRYGMRGMPPGLASRYGLGMRPPPITPVTPPAAIPARGPATLHDEHQLEITLSLLTVRNNLTGKVPKAAPPPPDPMTMQSATFPGAPPTAEQPGTEPAPE